jgi:phenylacetate-CoA ligase
MTWDAYSRFFGRNVFPILDRLNGTTITEKLPRLLDAERRDPAEIRRRQEAAAARTVERARRASGFYRRLWEQRDGPASEWPALDRLPVVTKADFVADPGAFPLRGTRGRVYTCRTSGSTGQPMEFHHSAEQESWFWALRFRMWRWAGYHPGDPYLEINLNPRTSWKKKLQDRLFRCTYLTFNADNQDSARIVEALRRKRIPHLNGFASSLFVLARYLMDRGIENPGVIGITSTGDTLDPVYRGTIERAFGVRVHDYYGAGGEAIHLASQCPESGGRYHLHPENALVEVLGADGPAPPGELGRIVVTQFHNDAMPLVRYELGDVGALAPADARCTCGRTLPLLDRIEGRVPDLIALPDGSFLVMHFFVVLFKNVQAIHRYQVEQTELERVVVRLVKKPDATASQEEIEEAVRRGIADGTRGTLAVDFEWVDEIPLTGRGKRRLIISRISRERLFGG